MYLKLTATLCATVLAVVSLAASTSAAPASGGAAGSLAAAPAQGLHRLASAPSTYSPPPGAVFNRPSGTRADKHRVIDRVDRAISSTRRGSTIRIATWAIDIAETTDRLVSAYRRGVNVRMVLNDNADTVQLHRLQRILGTDIGASSFAVQCRHGCRGAKPATMHAKYYLFSQAGRSSKVVMVSSANLTKGGIYKGWNDLFTAVGNNRLYAGFRTVFTQMRTGKPVDSPYKVVTTPGGRFKAYFYPRPGDGTRATDTTYQNLSRVRCAGARNGTGVGGRTVIRVSMFYWTGARGENLARKLLSLDNSGCLVKVIYGAPSPRVSAILRRHGKHGGINVRNSRYDTDGDGLIDKRVHTKYLLISGVYAGNRSSWYVFTGSENWTKASLRRSDEVTLRIRGKGTHNHYVANFNDVYITGSRATPYSN